MTYQDSNNIKQEDSTFSMVLGLLSAAAIAIASIDNIIIQAIWHIDALSIES